jgi:hypothetical protein
MRNMQTKQGWLRARRLVPCLALLGLAISMGACEDSGGHADDYESPGATGDACSVDSDCFGSCVSGICASSCGWREDYGDNLPTVGECVYNSHSCSESCCNIVAVPHENCAEQGVSCPDGSAWFVEGYCEPDPNSIASGGSGGGDECNSDSDCGYKQECSGGSCVSVECTSDSHCGSCERCSDNVCRDCGEGPYGCYC